MLSLLYYRLQPLLSPYTAQHCHPSLVEVTIDEGRPVELHFADRTIKQLPLEVGVTVAEALQQLAAAQMGAGAAAAVSAKGLAGQFLTRSSAADNGEELQLSGGEGVAGGTSVAQPAHPVSIGVMQRSSCGSDDSDCSSMTSCSSNGGAGGGRSQPGGSEGIEGLWGGGGGTSRRGTSVGSGLGRCSPATTGAAAAAAARAAVGVPRFGSDNRMGLPNSLHRISAIRNKTGGICGLTYRIGRHIPGVGRLILDILAYMKQSLDHGRPQSLLLLGRPGVGKTTLLRDVARLLSDPQEKGGLGLKVVVVDTSNEIGGDADQVHECVGRARRMMVRRREQQAEVLVEAVQNHSPEVIIVDEIGTKEVCEGGRVNMRAAGLALMQW